MPFIDLFHFLTMPYLFWLDSFPLAVFSLLRHDLRSGSTEVLLSGINFANGIALNADESALVVAETAQFRLRRWEVTRCRAPASAVSPRRETHLVCFPFV